MRERRCGASTKLPTQKTPQPAMLSWRDATPPSSEKLPSVYGRHVHVHVHMHTHLHMHIHTHIHTPIYMHTHSKDVGLPALTNSRKKAIRNVVRSDQGGRGRARAMGSKVTRVKYGRDPAFKPASFRFRDWTKFKCIKLQVRLRLLWLLIAFAL